MATKRQTELKFKYSGRGGYRPGAGRPRTGCAGVPHRRRPKLSPRHPAHVTLRVRHEVWNLRSRRCFRAIARAFATGKDRFGFRLIHFSIQGNHLHLVVEAGNEASVSRGMQGLSIRLAKGLNRVMNRRGPVFSDRYHEHVLRTPTEVARAIDYVLGNYFRHMARLGAPALRIDADPYSSAAETSPDAASGAGPPLVVEPQTWLLSVGWRRVRTRAQLR